MPFANDVTMPILSSAVTIWTTVGQVPVVGDPTANPAVLANPPTPNVGDIVINRADGAQWVYAPDPANPGQFVWEPITLGLTRGSIVYVGSAPFDAANINPPYYGMSADTRPDPSTMEPFGGDVYISTVAGDISLLAGPSPVAQTLQAAAPQHVYVGAGPFNAGNVAAPLWGMAAGTLPDPATVEPKAGDIYFDTTNGDVYVLG